MDRRDNLIIAWEDDVDDNDDGDENEEMRNKKSL